MNKIPTNQPLKLKMQTNGVFRLQGIYTLKDQEGFPIDMSFEMAKERGWDIDFIEALADAGRQSIFKYDGLIDELKYLVPNDWQRIQDMFGMMLMSMRGGTFCEKAESLYNAMH